MVHLEEHTPGSANRTTGPPLESSPVHTRTMPHGGSLVLPATGTPPCGKAPPTRYGYRDSCSVVAVTRDRMLAAMDSDHGGPRLATYCTPGVSRRVRHAASSDRETAQEEGRRARDQSLPGPAARPSGSRDRPCQGAAAKGSSLSLYPLSKFRIAAVERRDFERKPRAGLSATRSAKSSSA